MGRVLREPYEAGRRLSQWASQHAGYISGRLIRDHLDIDTLDLAAMCALVESYMVDSLPTDDRLGRMDDFRRWLYSPLVITAENWGETPDAVAAARAMEALSPPAAPRVPS